MTLSLRFPVPLPGSDEGQISSNPSARSVIRITQKDHSGLNRTSRYGDARTLPYRQRNLHPGKNPMRKTETAASRPMSDGEHAQSAHVLRDDELDVVSGGMRKGGAIIV